MSFLTKHVPSPVSSSFNCGDLGSVTTGQTRTSCLPRHSSRRSGGSTESQTSSINRNANGTKNASEWVERPPRPKKTSADKCSALARLRNKTKRVEIRAAYTNTKKTVPRALFFESTLTRCGQEREERQGKEGTRYAEGHSITPQKETRYVC